MADIYIAYAREDHAIAEKLHGLLSQQWDTWWDDKITGRFSMAIESEIPKAGCMVPLFSASSRSKDTFTEELRLGQKHGVQLLPIRLDDSDPPYPFGAYSYTELRNWNGEVYHPGYLQLLRRLATIVPPKTKPQRPLATANARVPLPTLFLSVSSHETQLVPVEAVQALRVFAAPTILVSAYDMVARRKPQVMINELKAYRENGGFVLVDSGNYEASRLGSRRWKSTDLKEALAQTPHDWAFCFDVMNPKQDPDRAIDEIVEAVERDREFTDAPVLPIVHAPKLKQGGYKLDHIPRIICEVADRLEPQLIAIPERELGAGLIARAKTVKAIRKELSKLPFYQPLHLLGTGNPWSIAVLTAAGADTFDGLEWCRVVADHATDTLHHFQHFDFFTYQTALADSIASEALNDPAINFTGKVAFHNLDYFTRFAKDLREAVTESNLEAFVVGLVGKDTANQLKKHVSGLFK
ncbi:toll/interleukin-1 receptor domain-containing protein [Paraburkholderia kururiensis]|uniref:Toll/interleukin-1 receptor domain-containing protein n=1 Tax=Paraburkholderia kururiensis TaxID=984307 RepID=A0ABZ0WDS3_9BURK|nr:toll/interleukin-1 receptor domain-containing protein [Paraburkholderia kururiensis]WQD75485.1 toll/interleukin-1 receptor domain-containing protein [Paraburkholderia kururiensis]